MSGAKILLLDQTQCAKIPDAEALKCQCSGLTHGLHIQYKYWDSRTQDGSSVALTVIWSDLKQSASVILHYCNFTLPSLLAQLIFVWIIYFMCNFTLFIQTEEINLQTWFSRWLILPSKRWRTVDLFALLPTRNNTADSWGVGPKYCWRHTEYLATPQICDSVLCRCDEPLFTHLFFFNPTI